MKKITFLIILFLFFGKVFSQKYSRIDSTYVYFSFDKHELALNEQQRLQDFLVQKKLLNLHGVSFEISAYTDEKGDDNYNKRLSEKRANRFQNICLK